MSTPGPTFVGIGAHKAGTSWLWLQLRRHPEIWCPPVKELHYFDRGVHYATPNTLATASPLRRALGSRPWQRRRMLAEAGEMARLARAGDRAAARWRARYGFGRYDDEWYRSLFAAGAHAKARGEVTPAYSMLEAFDVGRMRDVDPDLRIVLLLRDPVERAWSHVRFDADRGYAAVDLDDDAAVITTLLGTGAVLRGDYERTLHNFERHFPGRQILVGFHDAIARDPDALLQAVAGHLGVGSFPSAGADPRKRVNAAPPREMSPSVREFLHERYGGMVERLAARFGGYAEGWRTGETPPDAAAARVL